MKTKPHKMEASTEQQQDPKGEESRRVHRCRAHRRRLIRPQELCGRRQAVGFGALMVFLTLAAACTVGPDYVRPPEVVPEAYKEMQGWKVAEPMDHLVRGKWWELFDDPQLSALEDQVDISNQNIAGAEAQFRQARALVQAARSAYFPTATIGSSLTRSFQTNPSTPTGPVSFYSLPVDVSWEPDLFGRVRRSVESGRAIAQATAADLEGVRLTIQAEVAQDYFQLRTLDTQKQILAETVTAFRKSHELTKNRYAAGVASRADVLQGETQLKSTQAQEIDVGVQRAQLEHAIAVLIGKPAWSYSIPFAPLTALPPPIPVGLPSELLERRPDIAAAERRMASANAQIGVAMAAYYPTVTLSALGGFQSLDLANWLTWPARFWAVGAAISETLFEGGLRRAQTEEARAAYDATVASYRQMVLIGFQEVEDNLAALRILGQEAAMQEEAVKAAQDSVVVTMNQYKAGIVAYLNVIVIQAAALNNQRVAMNIQGQRMTAAVLLIKALGGGWSASDLPNNDSFVNTP
jgi:NodT family efflux transporter outer membrane factor (OMF) lipoprotein